MEKALAPFSAGAARFFRWWFGELAHFLPARWRSGLKHERRQLLVDLEPEAVAFCYRRGGALRELGSVPVSPGSDVEAGEHIRRLVGGWRRRVDEVVLRLPRGKVLRRRVELPLAAAENLREVLGFEMDRHTPFGAEEVYFDYRLVSTDRSAKRLVLDLAVAPRTAADEAVQRLANWGLETDRLEGEEAHAADGESFDLLPTSRARSNGGWGGRFTVGLTVLACLLLAVAVYLPVREKEAVLASAEAQLEVAKAEAAAASALGDQVAELLTRGRFVIGQKSGKPTFAELLNEVTDLLPDDTWLVRFSWNGDRVMLSGYSASSSELIKLLEDSDFLKEARFSSPLTVDQRIGLERFNLSAELEGRPGS